MILSVLRILKHIINNHGRFKTGIKHTLERNVRILTDKNGRIILEYASNIRENTFIYANGGMIDIGHHFFANRNVSITSIEAVRIGNNVQIANNVVIVDHNHDYKSKKGFVSSAITIEDNVWIGANVVILMGAHIGHDSVIAAGSIVSGEVSPNSLYLQKRMTEQREIEKSEVKNNDN